MRAQHAGTLTYVLIALASTAQADISFVDLFGNISYEQVGDGNTLNLNGTFFSAELNATAANAYTSASLIYPGPGSPQNLTQTSPAVYGFQTGFLPDLAAMQAAYPFGTYTFQGVNGMTTDTATADYLANDFAQSNPYLTGTDYSSLRGMNAAQPFTFHFSPYVTGNTATDSFIFFTIFDNTKNQLAFNEGFLPATTTSVVLPANTLTPGDSFTYELDYSNRNIVNGTGANFAPELGFDVRSDGVFNATAVPEPRFAVLLGLGLLGLVGLKRRSKAAA